jgi:adenylate cyclase
MPRITIIGPEGRQDVELQQHNTLGRHPNNTVQVLDRIVSKEHCHIDHVEGRWLLRDLGSLNGSYVNGERISERALHPGDEITLGSTRLIFDADGAGRSGHAGAAQAGAHGSGGGIAPPTPVMAPPRAHGSGQHAAASPGGAMPQGQGGYGAPPQTAAGGWQQPGQFGGAASVDAVAPWSSGPGVPPPSSSSSLEKPEKNLSKVTIAPGMVESHIRTKLAPLMDQSFLPEKLIHDADTLRRDYEKLRVSYELARAIGAELDIHKVLNRILEAAFQVLPADRGVILLYDDARVLQPSCVRTRASNGSQSSEATEQVLISKTIVDQVERDRAAVLSSDATVDSRFQGAHSIIMQGIRSSMAVPLLHSTELFGIMLLDSQIATNAFTEKDLQLFQNVANQAAIAIQNSLFAKKLEQEAVTRERFQRLLSPAIAQQVLDGKVEIAKGGEARQTTVLFSDIRGFTSMSESESPQIIVDMLNEYFELMVEVIFKYEGTLDKFVGDEIMCLFGAPVGHPDDATRAVRTAIEMMDVLAQLNIVRKGRGEPEIKIGIGINSGDCVAGYLGSSKALEYTVIGDTVNTGARLCSLAKAGEIIISHNTFDQVSDQFEVIELPPTQVKGKSQALKIYNVIGDKKNAFSVERTRPA